MKTLNEIYLNYQSPSSFGDKGTVHSYIDVYEQLFKPYRKTAKRVLEVGILTGVSLLMWEQYFDKSEVHGIDLNACPLAMPGLERLIQEGTHNISLLDATNTEQVEARFNGMLFDVVIEDANHQFKDNVTIYRNFKQHLAPGGIYVIEDIEAIDQHRSDFEQLDPSKNIQIIDLRLLKNRFDDVLVVIQDK